MFGLCKISIKQIFIALIILFSLLIAAKQSVTGGLSGGDSIYYYSALRSIIIDNDLDFENEYQFFINTRSDFTGFSKLPIKPHRNKITGKHYLKYPIGTIISWAPFFILAQIIGYIAYFFSGNTIYVSGFSQIHYYLVSLSSIFFSALAFFIIFRYMRKYLSISKNEAFLGCLLAALATPLTYYILFLPTYSHAASMFWCSLFVFFFLEIWRKAKLTLKNALLLSFLFTMAILTRSQNFLLLIIPAMIILFSNKTTHPYPKFFLPKILLFFLTSFILFAPQLLLNNYLHGGYLSSGIGALRFPYLLNPKIFYVLFSLKKGLFVWAPLTLISTVGVLLIKEKALRLSFILFFLLQLYIVSSWYYFNQGDSYSIRMLINCSFMFALGMALLAKRYQHKIFLLYNLAAFFIVLNFLLMTLFALRLIGQPYGYIWKSTIS